VTTVLVTHDQEEAMEVADKIVVMNHGRIEQIGAPEDVYEHPANEFVMGFMGRVNRIGNALVRPHDIEIRLEPNGVTSEARVERVVALGFEVRVELVLPDGSPVSAQITRDESKRLRLAPGDAVYVRPSASRVFAGV
jgi:sulfate transport system ATP-binding protein